MNPLIDSLRQAGSNPYSWATAGLILAVALYSLYHWRTCPYLNHTKQVSPAESQAEVDRPFVAGPRFVVVILAGLGAVFAGLGMVSHQVNPPLALLLVVAGVFAVQIEPALLNIRESVARLVSAHREGPEAIAAAAALGFALTPDEARDIAVTWAKITAAANEQLGFTHPSMPDWDHISFCQIAAPVVMRDGIPTGSNAVAIHPDKIDRSPCDTGCSARIAVLYARGALKLGDRFTGISLIDSEFHCAIAAETSVVGRPAIVPTLSGRAWITGTHQHMLDPADP